MRYRDVPVRAVELTMPALMKRAAEHYADRDLLVMPGVRLTFGDVERRSRLLARRLLAQGVGKATRVGLQFGYSAEFLVAFIAITRIGALAVPSSPSYTPRELAKSLRRNDVHTFISPIRLSGADHVDFVASAVPSVVESDQPVLFVEDVPFLRRIAVIEASADRPPWVTHLGDESDAPMVSEALLEQAEREVFPADEMVVIQTSGSTAEPKGVVHTHGAVLRKMTGPLLNRLPEQRGPHAVFAAMPPFWIGGLIILASALAHGTTMVALERFDVEQALDLVEQERCLGVSAWVGVLHAMRTHPSVPDRDLACIPQLTESVVNPPYKGPLGMTETIGPYMVVPDPALGFDVPPELAGSNGVVDEDYEMRIATSDGTVIDGDGEGEIWVRGYGVLEGMYKRERHEVFDVDGWYPTGDGARRVGDLYFFTGRVSETIKTNGNNVSPAEVEAVLAGIPGIRVAHVVGLPDDQRGEIVAAVVVPLGSALLDAASILAAAGEELSRFKIPRVLEIVDEASLPMLATGKIDKRALQRWVAQRAGVVPRP